MAAETQQIATTTVVEFTSTTSLTIRTFYTPDIQDQDIVHFGGIDSTLQTASNVSFSGLDSNLQTAPNVSFGGLDSV